MGFQFSLFLEEHVQTGQGQICIQSLEERVIHTDQVLKVPLYITCNVLYVIVLNSIIIGCDKHCTSCFTD